MMKKIVSRFFWLALLVAFFAFGLNIYGRMATENVREVFGLDYVTFMEQMRDVHWITYTGFRHPGMGLVLSPVVIVASLLSKIDHVMCDHFIVGVMAIVGVLNVWLVKKIAGWFAAAVFLCFGFTWILASVPESFPFSMTCLLLLVVLCRHLDAMDESEKSDGGPHYLLWLALIIVTTAVTVTNGLKVAIAFAIYNWRNMRATRIRMGGMDFPLWVVLVGGIVVFLLAGIGFFSIRMARWNLVHPEETKSIAGALAQTFRWIPEGLGFGGRLRGAIVGFASIPLLPVFSLSGLGHPETPSILDFLWSFCWLAWAVTGAVLCWHMRLVRVIVGMFLVDIGIHVVCGWGLEEGWVFCAHWFWMVPVLVALSIQRGKRF